ncbi:unnamed protein product [Urochloa humidicola]
MARSRSIMPRRGDAAQPVHYLDLDSRCRPTVGERGASSVQSPFRAHHRGELRQQGSDAVAGAGAGELRHGSQPGGGGRALVEVTSVLRRARDGFFNEAAPPPR